MPFTEALPDKNQIDIELDKLVPFKGYPLEWFSKGQRFQDMIDEICETGICDPIYIRPLPNENYEILNGHYRVAAAKELRLPTIPAIVLESLTDEDALSYVSDTNPIGLLLKHGIDIYAYDYKESKGYKNIENTRISFEDTFSMALDEYIERFLLTDYEIYSLYESIYSLGNPEPLNEEECKYETLAYEIVQRTDPGMDSETKQKIKQLEKSKKPKDNDKAEIEKLKETERINDKVNAITRQLQDYTRQLKKYLNIDIELFDYNDFQNKRERIKILYFVFTLKKEFHHINILELLSKPSMENIDNAFLGWQTSNGKYIREVKRPIEKEISLTIENDIKKTVHCIVDEWGSYMTSACEEMECLAQNGYDISDYIILLNSAIKEPFISQKPVEELYLSSSPLKMLYLRLVQYEYLGQMKDLSEIYKAQADLNCPIPEEYIKEMERMQSKKITEDNIDVFFEAKNVRKIAKYVYLKSETNTEERRKIRRSKENVLKLLNFTSLAEPDSNVVDDITELLMISCLQVIILDKGKEKFDYTFHKYEGEKGKRKGKQSVNKALTSDKRPYDAFQAYWLFRVKDRIYQNIGKSALRKSLKEMERMCVSILEKILSCSTIEEMLSMHIFYNERLMRNAFKLGKIIMEQYASKNCDISN